MIKAAIKLALLLLWTGLWFFPVLITDMLGKKAWRNRFVRICSGGLLRIAGITLTVHGTLSDRRPLLVVSNHLTYFDVPMLASHAHMCFTPKREIKDWPLIGRICRMTDCIFVERRPEKLKEGSQTMREALAKGDIVSLFPESTTGNGIRVLPFRSSFFSLAESPVDGRELVVQPAVMTYTNVRRLPVDSTLWPHIAWYGDMGMFSHLRDFLMLGAIEAELHFLPPVTLAEHGDRKRLAAHCQQLIAETIEGIRERRTAVGRQSALAAMVANWSDKKI